MNIRITNVPRTVSPNSGYHPFLIGSMLKNMILVIPSNGNILNKSKQIHQFITDKSIIKKIFPIRILRIITLLLIFLKLFKLKRQVITVHSFIFGLPVLLSGHILNIVIHGSDKRHIRSTFGKMIGVRARCIMGVGLSFQSDGMEVEEIPNIIDLSLHNKIKNKARKIKHDIIFVIRNSTVKNPSYPFNLYQNLSLNYKLNISVVGINEEESLKINNNLQTKKDHSIKYFGVLPYSEVVEMLYESQIFILPSHSEGISKAMLEAISCGCEIICNDSIKIPEYLKTFVKPVDIYNWDNINKLLLDRIKKKAKKNFAEIEKINNSSILFLLKKYRKISIKEG